MKSIRTAGKTCYIQMQCVWIFQPYIVRDKKQYTLIAKEVCTMSRTMRRAAPLFLKGIFLASAIAGICVANNTAEHAKRIALHEVSLQAEDVVFERPTAITVNGEKVLRIAFSDPDGTRYEFDVNEKTGEIVGERSWVRAEST